MKIVAKPVEEKEILATTKEDAKAAEIQKGLISKAECCVVHLCGCK